MSIEVEVGQNCSVCGVVAEDVDSVWNACEPLINRALKYSRGELTSDDIRRFIEARIMQLWIAHDENHRVEACMVTQIICYPRKTFLRIVTIGGKGFKRWEKGWALLELWARQAGCDGVESFARPGIARWAKSHGFREYYSMIGLDFLPLDVH